MMPWNKTKQTVEMEHNRSVGVVEGEGIGNMVIWQLAIIQGEPKVGGQKKHLFRDHVYVQLDVIKQLY